jgi:hypothetical protein
LFAGDGLLGVDMRRFFGSDAVLPLRSLLPELKKSTNYRDQFWIEPSWYYCFVEDRRSPLELADPDLLKLGEFVGHYAPQREPMEIPPDEVPAEPLGFRIRYWSSLYYRLWETCVPDSAKWRVPMWGGSANHGHGDDWKKLTWLLYSMGFPTSDVEGLNNYSALWEKVGRRRIVEALYDFGLLCYNMQELEQLGVFGAVEKNRVPR